MVPKVGVPADDAEAIISIAAGDVDIDDSCLNIVVPDGESTGLIVDGRSYFGIISGGE